MNKHTMALYGVLLLAGLAAPFVVYPVLMMKLLCFALFACAFNLLIGYTGLLSFGHAAFLGGAGYITGYVIQSLGATPEIGILLGTAFAALVGLVMGWLAIRRTGIYFTMITLALAQMLFFVWLQAPFTGGEDGLQGVPRGKLFGLLSLQDDVHLYYLVFAIFVFGFWLVRRVIHSPFGQVLQAIKENEPRAVSLGYDVNRFKLLAFVLSAALSGLAGSTKVLVMGFETLTDAQWTMSGTVVLMTLVGGMGTLLGPVVGAFVIMILENKMGEIGSGLASVTGIEWFNQLGESVTIVTGFIFVICVMAFRRGIVGEILVRLPKGKSSTG
ncbi:branched-chain amino acid ABC transporter permease [Comamonas serinivorans]|nr:branched-chain amino acid ABC transporter permease [Comamonas serinivorans]